MCHIKKRLRKGFLNAKLRKILEHGSAHRKYAQPVKYEPVNIVQEEETVNSLVVIKN